MVLCMFLTAATELGTGQWIETLLGQVGVSAILIFVFINGIMAVGRLFAGPVVHKLNPAGMLLLSAIFTTIGLYWLSNATGYANFRGCVRICHWHLLLLAHHAGFVSEYIPKTGAIGLNIMGGAGMLSVAVILPFMGNWFDNNKAKALQAGADAATANLQAGGDTLTTVMIMPIILIVAFAILFFAYRNKSKVEPESRSTNRIIKVIISKSKYSMDRKLRMGMIGGGKDAFIGAIHRIAANMDGLIELKAGALSINPEIAQDSGRSLFLESDRIYTDFKTMLENEAKMPADKRLDFITIVTPNFAHFEPAMMALDKGFNVVIEKPITFSLDEAKQLKAKVEADRSYPPAHTYLHRLPHGKAGPPDG